MLLLTDVEDGARQGTLSGTTHRKKRRVRLDVGRNLALLAVIVVAYVCATVLYLTGKDGPASGFTGIGSLILGAQFGVVVGETNGLAQQ
jgi:hypothetical protein